jgi:hypothetical protein
MILNCSMQGRPAHKGVQSRGADTRRGEGGQRERNERADHTYEEFKENIRWKRRYGGHKEAERGQG